MSGAALRQARLLDIPVTQGSHEMVLDEVATRVKSRASGGCVAITNTESMYHALRRPDHARYLQQSQLSLCDGVGVIAAGWFWGLRISRYNGPIFMLDCIERGQGEGWRHFFFGGKPGVAEQMAARLSEQFPDVQIAGTYAPPFRPLTSEEVRDVITMINNSKPDFVWVGLGLLKQEKWIAEHAERIEAPWLIGVGAAFDYHSGAVRWAPPAMRALGLEWLFRLIIQPRLRARRYWWSLVFVVEAMVKGLTRWLPLRNAATRSDGSA